MKYIRYSSVIAAANGLNSMNLMDAVSLHPSKTFNILVFLYVYDTRERIYIEKAYAWRIPPLDTIVYLQDDEKEAKVISQAEYETFEAFHDD